MSSMILNQGSYGRRRTIARYGPTSWRRLGNLSIQVTLDTYGHLVEDLNEAAVQLRLVVYTGLLVLGLALV